MTMAKKARELPNLSSLREVVDKVLSDNDLLAEILANDTMSRADVCKRVAQFCRTSRRCNDEKLWQAIAAKMGIATFRKGTQSYRELVDAWCKVLRDKEWYTFILNLALQMASYDRVKWLVDNGNKEWWFLGGEKRYMIKWAARSADIRIVKLVYELAQQHGNRVHPVPRPRELEFLASHMDSGMYIALKNAREDMDGAAAVLEFFLEKGSTIKMYRALYEAYIEDDLLTIQYADERNLTTRDDIRKLAERRGRSTPDTEDFDVEFDNWARSKGYL